MSSIFNLIKSNVCSKFFSKNAELKALTNYHLKIHLPWDTCEFNISDNKMKFSIKPHHQLQKIAQELRNDSENFRVKDDCYEREMSGYDCIKFEYVKFIRGTRLKLHLNNDSLQQKTDFMEFVMQDFPIVRKLYLVLKQIIFLSQISKHCQADMNYIFFLMLSAYLIQLVFEQ